MLYQLSSDFIKISETFGTVQNTSAVHTIEMSQSDAPNSGILIYPLQKHSFKDTAIFLRCTDGGSAIVRVVPFELDVEGGEGSVGTLILNGEEYKIATNTEIYNLIDDIWGKED